MHNVKIVKSFLRLTEKSFIVLGLPTLSGAIYALVTVGLLPQSVLALIKYSVWAMSIILVCIFWKRTLFLVIQNILLCILIALAFISFCWSEFPNITLSVAIEILIMSFFGLYFATRFSLKEQVQLVAFTLLTIALICTIFALVFPEIGIDHEEHPGAWKGIYGQKNALGSMMVLSSLTFFSLPNENSIIYKLFGFSFSLVLMLLSTSKSSLVISFLLIFIMVLYKDFRWQGKISVIFLDIAILILGCTLELVLTYWVEILTGLGRNPTLTGRTPLWGYALVRLMERPLFGYGLDAFWAPGSEYAVEAGQAVGTGWVAPNAHNGLLDLTLNLGLIGTALFLITYLTTFARVLKQAYATRNPENLWPLAYFIFLAMSNATESSLLGPYNMNWILYITIVLTVNQKSKSEKISNLAYGFVQNKVLQ